MKIFTNQKIWKKIVIVLLITILFQIFIYQPVQAEDEMPTGGKLMEPVLDLVIGLGDRNSKCFT